MGSYREEVVIQVCADTEDDVSAAPRGTSSFRAVKVHHDEIRCS